MSLSPRLRAARWAVLEAQATLDRSEALRTQKDARALTLWLEICSLRRAHWQQPQEAA